MLKFIGRPSAFATVSGGLFSFLFFLSQVYFNLSAYGQGAATVFPLSKVTDSKSATIDFVLQNMIATDLSMSYLPLCDIDGKELKGDACLEFFDVTFSLPMKDNKFSIPRNERLDGKVSLKKSDFGFALFKPNFDPILKNPENAGVTFAFGYQPGYLFVLKSPDEKLPLPTFKVADFEGMRRAKFDFKLDSLTTPSLLNISAKLLEQKTGKLVRFFSLAREKIVDPKRKELLLETDYAKAGDTREVCYELFVDNQFAKSSYKLTNCLK